MFSPEEKSYIAAELEKLLLGLGHPEMPKEKVSFKLHVDGAEGWSWADIEPNWKIPGAVPPAQSPSAEVTKLTVGNDTLRVGDEFVDADTRMTRARRMVLAIKRRSGGRYNGGYYAKLSGPVESWVSVDRLLSESYRRV